MFGTFSRKLRSGGADYPTPHSLIRHMVAELIGSRRWSWVTFETKPLKRFVEVAVEGDKLIVNVGYGFREDYQTVFNRQGVTFPDGWHVDEFEKQGWFTGGTMLLSTSIHDRDRVADFVDRLFPALFGEPKDYRLAGIYQ
jgi:hypothetical protein